MSLPTNVMEESSDTSDNSGGENYSATKLNNTLKIEQEKLQATITNQISTLKNNPTVALQKADDSLDDLSDIRGLMHSYHNLVLQGNHLKAPDNQDETQRLGIASNCLSTITEEVECMRKLISNIEIEIKSLDQEYADHDQQIKSLKEMTVRREIEGDMKQETQLDKMILKARKIQRTYRSLVNSMIEELFSDQSDEIKDILQDLCSSFFKGSDMYIDVPDYGRNPILGMLLEARIIKRNPYDASQIKLTPAF